MWQLIWKEKVDGRARTFRVNADRTTIEHLFEILKARTQAFGFVFVTPFGNEVDPKSLLRK